MPNRNNLNILSVVGASSLKTELLSGDIERQRSAAAMVRAHLDAREQARRAGCGVIVVRSGKVMELDPDSPELPDMSELVEIVDKLFPRPAGYVPDGDAFGDLPQDDVTDWEWD